MRIIDRLKILSFCKIKDFYNFLTEEKDLFFLSIPFLLALGIAFYFGITIEPPLWVGLTCLFISGVTTYYYRNYYIIFSSTLIAVIVFVGFSSAQLRTSYVDTTLLPKSFGPTQIQGRIDKIQHHEKGMKLVLKDLQISRLRADHVPSKIRLHVNSKNTSIKSGQWVTVRAMLKPVPQPTTPHSFDFQRHSYFQGVGAIGFAYGHVSILNKENTNKSSLSGFFDDLRQIIQQRIQLVFSERPKIAALITAFLTGNKKTIDEETHEKVRAAGLAHLLAISGLHIGLVASLVFFTLRLLLAYIPYLALQFPIKKIAAIFAICAALFFTLLTGGSIPTIRAFLMTSIALSGVLLDRKAISLRTVAWAAIVILLVFPESLLGPSFQLSFAAVTALVAFYERRSPSSKGSKTFQYFKDVFASSFIATAATLPFAAYHFNRIALYGIGSNLLAVPLTVFWIMPLGVLSLILMPFGLENYALEVMGWGVGYLLWVADTTAQLPHAQLSIPTISNFALSLLTIGGLILCLFKSRLRLMGFAPIGLAILLTFTSKPPDILILSNGKLNAIRSQEGNIMMSNIKHARYTRTSWMKQWGAEHQIPKKLQDILPCDETGCTYTHTSGIDVVLNNHPMALREDCQKADILITPKSSPNICDKPDVIIDQHKLRSQGAHAIYLHKTGTIRVVSLKDTRGTRPWTVYGQ